jgi:hypothetical protein
MSSGDTSTTDAGTKLPKDFTTEWTINPLGISNVIKEVSEQAAQAFNIFDETPFRYLDEQATNIQNTFGLSKTRMSEFKQIVADVGPELVKMGLPMEDAVKTTTELMKGLKSSGTIAKETMVDLAAVSKLSNVSVETLATNFRNVGVSIYDVSSAMKNVINLAKEAGASVNAVSSSVSTNLKQLNMYNFSNGVDGIAKMAIQSERLGASMSTTFNLAEKLLSPESAIDLSSALQRLGVTSSELLDPLRAMDLAQNNPEELQNQMVELSKQFTQFNEVTGKMEIMPGAKRRLREIATELGYDKDEFASMALKASDFDRKLSQLKLPDFASDSKETKELIASMAQIKDGVATINIKDQKTGEVVLKQVDQLTPEDIEKLKTSQEEQGKSVEQLAIEQLDELKQIRAGIAGVGAAAKYGRATSGPLERIYESMMGVQKAVSSTAAGKITGSQVRKNVSSITEKAEDYLLSGLQGDVEGMKNAQQELGINLVKLEKNLETSSTEALGIAAKKAEESFGKAYASKIQPSTNNQDNLNQTNVSPLPANNLGQENSLKEAYEKPREVVYKGDLNIKTTVDVNGNENTKNLDKQAWNKIWEEHINDPNWKSSAIEALKNPSVVSAEVGQKQY